MATRSTKVWERMYILFYAQLGEKNRLGKTSLTKYRVSLEKLIALHMLADLGPPSHHNIDNSTETVQYSERWQIPQKNV